MNDSQPSPLMQARADLLEGLSTFRHTAMSALRSLDRDQALDDRLAERRMKMGLFQWMVRDKLCRMRGHDWQMVDKPMTIKRWCGRCWEVEST